MDKRRVCIRMKLKFTMGQPWGACKGFYFSAWIELVWKRSQCPAYSGCNVVNICVRCAFPFFSPQCLRNTGSWSPSCGPSWSPGPPSRSWSREASSGRGCSAVTWENTCSTQDMTVRNTDAPIYCYLYLRNPFINKSLPVTCLLFEKADLTR